ncbi:MAG: thioredoxin [Candidatus Alkanophagales archaeon]|nr:MAG: thioredoxin [Candidatus Alkanophagales archaeon]
MRRRAALRFLILAVFLALLAHGVFSGEPAEVLRNARVLCLSCLGL